MKQLEPKIKFVRLKTGDDIIANCIVDEKNGWVDLENPMRVVISRMNMGGKAILAMMPWLPLEIVDSEFSSVSLNDVITMVDVKDSFAEYYSNALQEHQEYLEEQHDDLFADDSEENEEDSDEEVSEEAILEEILGSLKDTRKRTIH